MVTTLLVVLILSVLAVGVAWIAGSEKKTSFAEAVHVRSVFAADAGGEAAINFIRMSDAPPTILDFAHQHGPGPGQHDPGRAPKPTITTLASSPSARSPAGAWNTWITITGSLHTAPPPGWAKAVWSW